MNIRRLYNTLRYLKPVQFYGRAWFRLYKPTVDNSRLLTCRNVGLAWVKPAAKVISLVGADTFCCLNQQHELASPDDWNHKEWEKLWLYNLHYFDDLNGVDAETRQIWHIDLLEKWVAENRVGQGNGWEPYPSSLRIVNWIKWSLAGNQLSPAALQSLEVQARYLRKRLEIHLLGNHLLANAKALVFAGVFFQGQEADGWLRKGLKILSDELPEQVLSDGGHFERSPMYHAIILEDLLDLINVLRVYDQTLPQTWFSAAGKMLFWLHGMTHPDGEIALLNDAAFGIAPRPGQLFAYAERLGLNCEWNDRLQKGLTHFEQTGYLRWQTGNAVAVLDVAKIGPDYLPGHAHADTLSFELSLYGQRLFVDSGTSCYDVSDERLRQRSTLAHNTVEVVGESSSEVWGGFRVARRARPENLTISHQDDVLSVGCAHDGYMRLPGKVTHRRQWDFNSCGLVITDTLSGEFSCAKARFYFHPDVNIFKVEDNRFVATLATGNDVELIFTGAADMCLENTTWHPRFGVSIQNKCLVVQLSERKLLTKINW